MTIDVISCVPGLIDGFLSQSILKRAQDNKLVEISLIDLREYGLGKNRKIDDYAFGGGAGMVLMLEPLVAAYNSLIKEKEYDEIIYLSPDGKQFDQKEANYLSLQKNIMLICGHYKGIDERFREHYVTKEISIGDYVLSGGEIAAAVVIDAITRLIPGVLNDESSALTDSFQDNLLAPPVYTRPSEYNGWKVPQILLSGDEKKIQEWRMEKSIERTKQKRPDLL